MPDSFDVFLSHTSDDKTSTRRIAEALVASGLRVWFDEWNLHAGMSWQRALEDGIANSRAVLIVIGNTGIGAWQQEEMHVAIDYRVKDRRPVIPVFLPDAQPSKHLPTFLRSITSIQIESWNDRDFQIALDKMIWGITGRVPNLPERKTIPKVFLCHAKEDDDKVRKLYDRLRNFGIDPWYDKEKLSVGDRWEQEIIHAIENTDFFAMCLSPKSVNKTGFIQREIKLAVKEYQRRPQQIAFLLPVRLEPCEVPSIKLDEVTTLSDFQWIDLFEENEDSLMHFAEGVKRQFAKINRDGN